MLGNNHNIAHTINIPSLYQGNVPKKDAVNFSGGAADSLKISSSAKRMAPQGFADKAKALLAKGIKKLETGGFFVEFVTIDVLSMMLPRTYQAFKRNEEELGHPNYKAGAEEIIREILTGPSMFFMPMAFVLMSDKVFGSSAKLQFSTLNKFNETFKNTCEKGLSKNPDFIKDEKLMKKAFYKDLVSEALKPYKEKATQNTVLSAKIDSSISKIVNNIMQMEENSKKINAYKKTVGITDKTANLFKGIGYKFANLANKLLGNNKPELSVKYPYDALQQKNAQLSGQISEIVINMSKKFNISPYNPSQVHLNPPKGKTEALSKNITGLAQDLIDYGSDIAARTSNWANQAKESLSGENLAKFLEKVSNKVKGGRILTNIVAIASTGAFLYSIPLFYQRNKEYPGVDGLTPSNNNSSKNSQNNNSNNIILSKQYSEMFNSFFGQRREDSNADK